MLSPNCLLIKTSSEISLKSHFVRKYFMDKLVSNMKSVFRANKLAGSRIVKKGGRLYLYPEKMKNLDEIHALLPLVFGIHSFAKAESVHGVNLKKILEKGTEVCKGFLKEGDSFAVRPRVVDNKELTNQELGEKLGSEIMGEFPGLKVNLSNPDKEVNVEIRGKDMFIYLEEIPGPKGLPLGVEGNVAMLFTGKKDDLVAAFLMMRRGCNIFPVVEKESKEIEKEVEKLVRWNSFRSFLFTPLQKLRQLVEKPDINVQALVSGETKLRKELKRIGAELPVFRPLIFYPKELLEEKRGMVYGN
ncbi:MAG: THUMP domain-containing protein [Candidatus Diapherotrites archaeon]